MSDLNIGSAQYCHQFAAGTYNNAALMTALTADRETPTCATGIEALADQTITLTLEDGRTKVLTVAAGWARAVVFTALTCGAGVIVYRSTGNGVR